MMIHKISPTVDYNQWWIFLNTELGVKKLEDSFNEMFLKIFFNGLITSANKKVKLYYCFAFSNYECFFLVRGHWAVYYTCHQSFIITFSDSLV